MKKQIEINNIFFIVKKFDGLNSYARPDLQDIYYYYKKPSVNKTRAWYTLVKWFLDTSEAETDGLNITSTTSQIFRVKGQITVDHRKYNVWFTAYNAYAYEVTNG